MLNISPINNKYQNTNFKARKIANAQSLIPNLPVSIDLYRCGREDLNFFDKLAEKINYNKLYPKINIGLRERWREVFDYCLMKAELKENTTYIAVNNNKICGIETYHNDMAPLYLDGICSIPTAPDIKVPLCGQTLMYQLFNDSKKLNSNGVILDALKDGPFNLLKFYEPLGFTKDFPEGIFGYIPMTCSRENVLRQLKKFASTIKYTPLKAEKTDLTQFIA